MNKSVKILGILGGGQLGRMSALAAARLGIRTHFYCPESDAPALQISSLATVAPYDDLEALKDFAHNVDVISYEFENIPLSTVDYLSRFKPVLPGRELLNVSQNRLAEKKFLNDIGIPTAPWTSAYAPADIDNAMALWRTSECIVKTSRFGYDGKGQIKHTITSDASETWSNLATDEAVIEGIVAFTNELSVIVARDHSGNSHAFPPTLNDHRHHILSESVAPAPIAKEILDRAVELGKHVAEKLQVVGVVTLELFVMPDGELIANEIAPRTHNSGHWTMDGCNVSQFDQHVRAVCGLPILQPVQHSAVRMKNLIGNDVDDLPKYFKLPNACIHLYGKTEARPGRKMGHINFLSELEK